MKAILAVIMLTALAGCAAAPQPQSGGAASVPATQGGGAGPQEGAPGNARNLGTD